MLFICLQFSNVLSAVSTQAGCKETAWSLTTAGQRPTLFSGFPSFTDDDDDDGDGDDDDDNQDFGCNRWLATLRVILYWISPSITGEAAHIWDNDDHDETDRRKPLWGWSKAKYIFTQMSKAGNFNSGSIMSCRLSRQQSNSQKSCHAFIIVDVSIWNKIIKQLSQSELMSHWKLSKMSF